jgi:pimeloyl-ACP methyl ester carboxylesterase
MVSSPKAVILIHGLMASSMTMKYLEKHLSGYQVYHFTYKSHKYSHKTLEDLDNLIKSLHSSHISFIGHSMGGLVARNYLHKYPHDKFKALITIATPHNESQCAKAVLSGKLGRFFGTAGTSGLTQPIPHWDSKVPLGCIAGLSKSKLSQNLFIMFSGNKLPSDGTVYISEAILKDSQSIVINGSHTGLLFKREVAEQCLYFLENYQFK